MAETIPILAKLPNIIAPWKEQVENAGEKDRQLNKALINIVRADLEKGAGAGSLVETMLNLQDTGKEEIEELGLASAAGTMFTAGSDTTGATLRFAILGLVTHPNVLRAAQAELDSVVGNTRSPNFDDKLPYIDALVQEALRWRPALFLSLPHATTEDDVSFS